MYFQQKRRRLKIFSSLKNCSLFAGLSETDLDSLLTCLAAKRRKYGRGEFIFLSGQRPDSVGIVLSGRVHLLKEDVWGRRNLIAEISAGDLFAEAIVCAGAEEFPLSAVAAEDAEALFINYRRVVAACSSACSFHTALIGNMLGVLAKKNMAMLDKLEHLTKRTTREKLLSYLHERGRLSGGAAFDIPFDRQALADYLSVERSALSAELSRMRAEGLIAFRRNHFELLAGRRNHIVSAAGLC